MLGPLGNKSSNHTQDPVIFDPTLKVKEEEKSDDETAPVNKASGTFLNRSPSVKLQPLDERSLKRLLSSRTLKSNATQPGGTGERQVHINAPHQKSSFKGSPKEKMRSKRVNGLTHSATEVQRVSKIVQSNGFEKVVNGSCEPQKEKFINSNFSQGSFLTNDKNGNWAPYTNAADQRPSPFDLRQMIGTGKNASTHTAVLRTFGHHEKNISEDNEMDSMSIHAEDDLELDYNEDLNELGKHFEAANSVTTSKEPGISTSPNAKRRHSDRDDHGAKKSKFNVTPEKFPRSLSSGEEREKHKNEYRRPSAALEFNTNDDIQQNGLRVHKDRIDSDPENRKKLDPRRRDSENLQNHKGSTQNAFSFNNTRNYEHQRKFQGVNEREQHVERRSFSKHHGYTPVRMNDFGLLGPVPMRGAHPNLSTGNDMRPFFTFPQFGIGSGVPIRPIVPHDVPGLRIRQIPPLMETGIHQNTHQMHQALDQKLTVMLQENNYESCIQVCQEFITHLEKVPLNYLETLLRTAAEGDVINLTSKTISFLFNEIRKVRATTGFRMEDFRYGVDAFIKVEDVDSAINLVFEMKRCGLSPSKTILLQIRNAIFATPVKSTSILIKFCDELGISSLFNKRLLEEVLKHVTFTEFNAQAKSSKVLELLQQVKIQSNAATLHSATSVIPSEFLRVLKQIDEISPQENIPSDLIVKLIQCVSSTSELLSVITKLSNFPKDVLLSVPSEIWNVFFIETCSGPFADVQFANQIHGIITDHDIPLSNKSLLEFATLLLKDGKDSTCKAAVEIIDRIGLSDVTLDDVTDNIHETLLSMIGNKKLCSSYDYKTAMILTKSKRFLADEKLNDVLNGLKFNSSYQEIHNIMLELEKADVKPSLETYELAVSSLEDWETNQEAFLTTIIAMKQCYPKHRIFKDRDKDRDTGSIVSSLSHSSGSLPITVSLPSPQLPTEAAAHATPDKTKLMQSPPALPLKSPFEEALNSQQNTVSVRIGQEQASSGNILAQKSTSIVEDLRPHEMAQRAVPPRTSAPRSIEFQDKPGYEQFYNELVFAVQNRNAKEVFNVYVKLRHEEIAIDNDVLLEMYKVLVENPSETFRKLTDVIRQEIPLVQAIDDEESLFLFQDVDQETLGRLGVRLLFNCLEQNECVEGFNLLFILHELNINYSLYGLGFGGDPNRTTCEITVAAVKICLGRDSPTLDGAMEVLRGASFAIPLNSEDDSERKVVLTKLANDLLDQDQCDGAVELISHSSNERGWSLTASDCFNATLLRLSEENSADRAMKVYEYMGKNDITKDHKAFRAYLNCHARNGNIVYARELFEIGRDMEIYPSQELTDPYFFELPCSLTQVEMLFMLEEHLRKIKRTVYEGNGSIRPLLGSQSSFKIIFKENYELFETSKEQFAIARENLIVVLSEKVKPPLRIIDTENPDEPLVIGVDSILRWYEDKPDFKHTLSVTSDVAANSLQRKVEISSSEEHQTSADNPTATKEPLTSPINGLAAPHGPSSDKERLNRVTNAVCERLKVYLHRGKVAKGKALQDCTVTLVKQYLKLNRDATFAGYDSLQSHVSSFVDNFFRYHQSFVPKHA